MQHERVGISAELGDNEGNPVRHQAADEMHVTGQAVELGNEDRTFRLTGLPERDSEFRPAVQRVSALPSLDLDMLGNEIESFHFREALDGGLLRLDPKPAGPCRAVETR